MIAAALAPLLFVYLAQSPPPDAAPDPADAYGQEQPVGGPAEEPYPADEPANGFEDEANGQEPDETDEQADRPADPVTDEADEMTEEAEEEEEDVVCRRVHYVDDFGRQRSRKSCTPR